MPTHPLRVAICLEADTRALPMTSIIPSRINNVLNKEAKAYWFYPRNGDIDKVSSFWENESRDMVPPSKREDAILVLKIAE
jgi:hypothetical protein